MYTRFYDVRPASPRCIWPPSKDILAPSKYWSRWRACRQTTPSATSRRPWRSRPHLASEFTPCHQGNVCCRRSATVLPKVPQPVYTRPNRDRAAVTKTLLLQALLFLLPTAVGVSLSVSISNICKIIVRFPFPADAKQLPVGVARPLTIHQVCTTH